MLNKITLNKIERTLRNTKQIGEEEAKRIGISADYELECYVNELRNKGWDIQRKRYGFKALRMPNLAPRCSAFNCNEPVHYHGLCKKHWRERE